MKDIWKILKYCRDLWPLYIGISLLTVAIAGISQVAPITLRQIVDRLTEGSTDLSQVFGLVVIMFAASLALVLIENISGYMGDIMAARMSRYLDNSYAKHLMRLPQNYFDGQQTGSIVNKLNRASWAITGFLNAFANNFLSMIVTSLFALAVVAYFYWPAALLMAMMYPIYFYFTERSSRHWQKLQKKINRVSDIAFGRFNQVVGQIKVVRAFNREAKETSKLNQRLTRIISITQSQSKHWHKQDIYRRLGADLITFIVLTLVIIQAFNGAFSVGTLVLIVTYTVQLRFPLFAMSYLVDNAQRAIAGSREFFEVMETTPEIDDKPGAGELKISGAEVGFEGVAFGYSKHEQVLNDVSFTIKPGQKLALVGESGQGKTTISNLLLRFYEPQTGRIMIDGQDISGVTQNSLRRSIGVVFQDPSLFSGSIAENISFGKVGAKTADMEAAARAANAHDFIIKLPKGYNTEIGERGVKLSGGQQQRIAIARAILNNPPILILDEATSSLDSKAEAQVQSALDHLMKGRTTLIIAHRLSTIKSVDTIVTLKNGQVDEAGPPRVLAKSGGVYSQLLALQTATGAKRIKLLKQYDLVS